MLKEHEVGAKTADLARKHGISEATIYNWKAKFGGMDVSEAKPSLSIPSAATSTRCSLMWMPSICLVQRHT